jgi:hypothetical protein
MTVSLTIVNWQGGQKLSAQHGWHGRERQDIHIETGDP